MSRNMSENLPVKSSDNPNGDFTLKDLEKIEAFKEKGMLGLATLEPTHVERAMSLYIDGKSYRQIANVLKVDRTILLFLSKKFSWYELRQDYLSELVATLKTKVVESKLQSQEFLLHVQLALQKKIGKDIDKFFRTGDDKFIDEVDSKHLASYLKITETIHKLDTDNKLNQSDKSLVSLNGLAEGVNITRTGTNSVEITPKSPFSSKLKAFADMKRQEEMKNSAPPKPVHDIVNETQNAQNPENEGSNEGTK
jgi:hypothetical protein